jgi:hypothetical protein
LALSIPSRLFGVKARLARNLAARIHMGSMAWPNRRHPSGAPERAIRIRR